MFKNQLQELAQRSCFNLPSYACIREGPDHAPRFKASVNFNGEIFESPSYCTTLRQAEHAAAEVALNVLSLRGPARSLTARVLDETGIYKNLLQETAHRAGLNLPVYTTVRSGQRSCFNLPSYACIREGPDHACTVELAGMNFTGEPAKTKKQAEKNAAIAAWSALKRFPNLDSLSSKEVDTREEQDQAVVARVLSNFRSKDEGRYARKRDHNQARRRMVRGHKDSSGASSSSTSNNFLLYPHRRLLDLILDSTLDGSTQMQKSSFLNKTESNPQPMSKTKKQAEKLLPPPPPRTSSKILPPPSHIDNPSLYSSNRPIPIQVKGKLQVHVPLEEHLKDEEEWLGTKPDVIKKHIEKESASNSSSSNLYGSSSSKILPPPSHIKPVTSLPDNTSQHESTHISSRIFGSTNPSPMASISIKTPSSTHVPRPMFTGGFNPHRIAPAVQIRSTSLPDNTSQHESTHQSSSATGAPSHSTFKGVAEVSMLNKTESNPQPSSTEFKNKLQLL
uniref:Double-stranded-RNA-binding protein 5 n=1 Tax=Populus tomentosa TaxID=118781 RepID=A0A385JHE9_POPTO|nr:Double-stranded-RNA-binding protein 5 [Populus tomentosa]